MDQIKIGNFISTMRKEQGLTQRQLENREQMGMRQRYA